MRVFLIRRRVRAGSPAGGRPLPMWCGATVADWPCLLSLTAPRPQAAGPSRAEPSHVRAPAPSGAVHTPCTGMKLWLNKRKLSCASAPNKELENCKIVKYRCKPSTKRFLLFINFSVLFLGECKFAFWSAMRRLSTCAELQTGTRRMTPCHAAPLAMAAARAELVWCGNRGSDNE